MEALVDGGINIRAVFEILVQVPFEELLVAVVVGLNHPLVKGGSVLTGFLGRALDVIGLFER